MYFLKKAAKEYYTSFKITDVEERGNDEIKIESDFYMNGYKLKKFNYNLIVSSVTHKVVNFNFVYPEKPSNNNIIDYDTAKNILFSENNMSTKYITVFEDGKYLSKPVYYFNQLFINAETGKLEDKPYKSYGSVDNSVPKNEINETEIVNKFGRIINGDEALKIIKDNLNIKLDYNDIKCEYIKYGNSKYILEVCDNDNNQDKGFYAEFNTDYDLINLYCSDKNTVLSGYGNIKNLAKKCCPNSDIPDTITGTKNKQNLNTYTFYNKYNNILDKSHYLKIDFDDNYNIKKIEYNYNDNERVEFKGFTNDEIFNAVNSRYKFEPVYIETENGIKLYYTFEYYSFYVDANNGDILDGMTGNKLK